MHASLDTFVRRHDIDPLPPIHARERCAGIRMRRRAARACRPRRLPRAVIVMADDFESGTRSAAFGGNTTMLPFCHQEKAIRYARP